MRWRRSITVLIIIFIIIIFLGTNLYLDWLWFSNLGLNSVFIIEMATNWIIRLITWFVFFAFLLINLMSLRRIILNMPNLNLRERLINTAMGNILTPRRLTLLFFLGSAFLALLLTSYTGTLWLTVRQFFEATSFEITDPIFGRDISFYVFGLPFYRAVYTFLQSMVVTALIITGVIYFILSPFSQVGRRWLLLPYRGYEHLSLLLSLVFILKAGDYRLQMYELLFSPRGAVFGAGYTDVNANLPALWILLVLALVIAGVLLFNIYRRQARILIYAIVTMVAASILIGNIYPALVQQFRVEPNELALERPFLKHNIELTRKAFALDRMKVREHAALQDLTWDELIDNPVTINNVRLWDYRPLQATYNQLQAIRLYYEFLEVDTDRYTIDGEYRQVMLAARELNPDRLAPQAQTWVNRRLQYTHGYGAVISPVNEATLEGLPRFILGDLPPQGELELDKPEIYYGELTNDVVIVNSNTPEFNYPRGDKNIYTHYEGRGGIPIQNLMRRLLFALKFGDYRILISEEINSQSRLMFNRNIHSRVRKAVSFLRYDPDPYLVVADGKLYWIQDAYTFTDCYPYSRPFQNLNYMRNSVKVVIDSFDGTLDYYVADHRDPIVQTYMRIFPNLFHPIEDMPEELKAHIRYPEEFFNVQGEAFAAYHMQDPTVFYNQEDLWEIPNEKYAGTIQAMESYYTIIQLPGEEEAEFVLMLPYTPPVRDNMISWLAGRSDGDNYGELILFLFPKDRVILGPMQIEARIDQDTQISQQLALWDQHGSRVIRGNLLVLPVSDSVIYVEPVFLQADDGELPELARVIVGYRDIIVMEPNLEMALARIFGERIPIPDESILPEDFVLPETCELARQAQKLFEQAQESLREGDWAGYGQFMQELEKILQQMVTEISDVEIPKEKTMSRKGLSQSPEEAESSNVGYY